MPKTSKKVVKFERSPSALSGEYIRSFGECISKFGDFDAFCAHLGKVFAEDPHLIGALTLADSDSAEAVGPDFEALGENELLLPVLGYAGNQGYLKYDRRRDGRPFDAEDLHLMGSIAGFVSALYSASRAHDQLKRRGRVLQFLIDQLPVGVVCFDGDGALIAGSSVAWRLLGLEQAPESVDSTPVVQALRDGVGERGEAHFEVDQRLMFVMRREFNPADGEAVSAYVIYDLSQRRERFQQALDREYYKARCEGSKLCLALAHSGSRPGAIYGALKAEMEALGISKELVQPIDAYTCGLALPRKCWTQARDTLKRLRGDIEPEMDRLSLIELEADETSQDSPVEQFLDKALKQLSPSERALLPRLLILDAYRPVFDTLEIVLDGVIEPVFCARAEDVAREVGTGRYDGLVVDLDSLRELSDLAAIKSACADAPTPVRIFYSSTRRREMLSGLLDGEARQRLLLKPFEAAAVQRAVAECFETA